MCGAVPTHGGAASWRARGCPMTEKPEISPRQSGLALLPRPVGVRRGGMAVAGALAAVGLLFAWQATGLDLGGIGLPGAGFFPLLMGAALAAFAAVIGGQLLREPGGG